MSIADALAAALRRIPFGNIQRIAAALDAAYGPLTGSNKLLATSTLGSDAANLDFTSIDQNYTDLHILAKMRSARAGQITDFLQVQVGNGSVDTGSNYRYHLQQTSVSATTDTQSESATALWGASIPGATADSGVFAIVDLKIFNYKTTGSARLMLIHVVDMSDSTAMFTAYAGGQWANTANAIDTIRFLTSTSSNLLAGSTAHLYGLGRV